MTNKVHVFKANNTTILTHSYIFMVQVIWRHMYILYSIGWNLGKELNLSFYKLNTEIHKC